MIGGGLEGCGPSQPRCAEIHTVSRRRRSGRPPGSASNVHPAVATMIGGGLEGLRSLAAAGSRHQHRFPGADGADALKDRPAMAIRSWQR
jgi:hypothetical protein